MDTAQVTAIAGIADGAGNEDIGQIVMNQPLHLLVERRAILRLAAGHRVCLLQQAVHLGILIADKVKIAPGPVMLRRPEPIVVRIGAQFGPTCDCHVIALAQQLRRQVGS